MPCDYSQYPADWKERRARVLARSGERCEECGAPNRAEIVHVRIGPGEWAYVLASDVPGSNLGRMGWKPVKVVLTIAHLDRTTGDPAQDGPLDCADDRLRALCQRCHLHLDKDRHQAARRQTLAARKANERAQAVAAPLEI